MPLLFLLAPPPWQRISGTYHMCTSHAPHIFKFCRSHLRAVLSSLWYFHPGEKSFWLFMLSIPLVISYTSIWSSLSLWHSSENNPSLTTSLCSCHPPIQASLWQTSSTSPKFHICPVMGQPELHVSFTTLSTSGSYELGPQGIFVHLCC